METELLESLQCPICLELPENEVYQCKNGHAICAGCSQNMRLCPQCRVPYEQEKIRNRVAEEILQGMKVECQFIREGCKAKMKRSDLKRHVENCEFRPLEFCKAVGFRLCNFSSGSAAAITEHLREQHQVGNILHSVQIRKPVVPVTALGLLKSVNDTFLITMTITAEGRNCSFQALHLAQNEQSTFECSFVIRDVSNANVFSWKLRSVYFKRAKECFVEPPMQIPFSCLQNNLSKQSGVLLTLRVSIIGGGESTVQQHHLKKPTTSSGLAIDNLFELREELAISTANPLNGKMVDSLKTDKHLTSPTVERVMRMVDRGNYTTASGLEPYKNAAWKRGNLHLSSPGIYAGVLEALDLKRGHRFLHIGSGTGYLSTMCGFLIGRTGFNCGLELRQDVVEFAEKTLSKFEKTIGSTTDICLPMFITGNFFDQDENSLYGTYDRIYCSAECPKEDVIRLKKLLKVGGLCIAPVEESMMKIYRYSENEYRSTPFMNVRFAPLVKPGDA